MTPDRETPSCASPYDALLWFLACALRWLFLLICTPLARRRSLVLDQRSVQQFQNVRIALSQDPSTLQQNLNQNLTPDHLQQIRQQALLRHPQRTGRLR